MILPLLIIDDQPDFIKKTKTLKDVLPYEFLSDFTDTKAYKFRDIEVIKEHKGNFSGSNWPGKHKNVYFWVELENGYAVGFNENPARGWSFPVIKYKKVLIAKVIHMNYKYLKHY